MKSKSERNPVRFFVPSNMEGYFLPRNVGARIWDRVVFLRELANDLARTKPCEGPVGEYLVLLSDFALTVVHAGWAPTWGKSAEDFVEIGGKRCLRRDFPDSPERGSRVIVVPREKAPDWNGGLNDEDRTRLNASDATHVIVDIDFWPDPEDELGPDEEWCECADEIIEDGTTKFYLAMDKGLFEAEGAGPKIRDRKGFFQALTKDLSAAEPYFGGKYAFGLSEDTRKLVDMRGADLGYSRAMVYTRQGALDVHSDDLSAEVLSEIKASDATHVITEIRLITAD